MADLVDVRARIGGLTLANPVLVAAGTFGYGEEFEPAVRVRELGALVIKTLTRQPREGNPPPRLVETPAGMLNAVGLQNVGLAVFLREKLPRLRALGVPVVVSILDDAPEGLAEMAAQLEHADGVAAIELNLSCPNLSTSAECGVRSAESEFRIPNSEFRIPMMVAQDAEATARFVAAARAATQKPLWAKLTPDVTDPRPIAQAAERAGADALVVCNTYTGMRIDPDTRRSRLGSTTGGLSGPAIHPLSLYRLWLVRQAVRCPLIGVGGVARAEEAIEFFLAGAAAVEVGTANFIDPGAALKVLAGLRRYLAQQHAGLSEIIGAFDASR